jgi:hypothetical protein
MKTASACRTHLKKERSKESRPHQLYFCLCTAKCEKSKITVFGHQQIDLIELRMLATTSDPTC